jgi:hypothetical protein
LGGTEYRLEDAVFQRTDMQPNQRLTFSFYPRGNELFDIGSAGGEFLVEKVARHEND